MESKVKQPPPLDLMKIYENDIKNEAMSRNIFWTRKKKEDETFDEFVMSLRTLSADCNFDKLKDSQIRDQIVLGIRNKQFKDRVIKENLDLNECINLYKSFEQEGQRKDKETLEINAVSNAPRDCRPTNGVREKNIIQGSLQGIHTSLKCRTVRIGSYDYTPKEKVHISLKGIVIVVPSLKTESRDVTLQIQLNKVVRISVYYESDLPMIILYTKLKCGAYVRRALEMSEESGLYYDPGSIRDAYQMIILFPTILSQEAKVVLQSMFGTLLSELNPSEAKEILDKIYCPKGNTPATKSTTMSASASIASGTKCSNPAETKCIVICPPDKGGIPINTEANTCLAQDHGGDGSKEEIVGTVQEVETSLSCRKIRIDSYQYIPKEKVHISTEGIKIVAPSLNNESRGVDLQIKLNEIVQISLHGGKGLPVIFLYTQWKYSAYIRRALEMSEDSGLYFDPESKNYSYITIILFPTQISEEVDVVLRCLFGKILNYLSSEEANEILFRAYGRREHAPVIKITKRYISRTKCSTSVKKAPKPICPPDKVTPFIKAPKPICPPDKVTPFKIAPKPICTPDKVTSFIIAPKPICSPDKVTPFKIPPKPICTPYKVTSFKILPKPICTPDKVTPFKIAKKPICTPDKFTLFKIAPKTICTLDKVTPFKIAPKPICSPDKVTSFKIAPKPICTPDKVTPFNIAPKPICPPDKVTPFKIAPKPICTPDKVTSFQIATKPICTPDKVIPFKIAPKPICTPDKVTPFIIAPKPICPPDKVTPFKIAPKPICTPYKVTSFIIAPKPICSPDKVTPFKIAPKPICTPYKVTSFKILPKPICTPDKVTPFKIAKKPICTPDKFTLFKIAPKTICTPDKVTPFKIAPKPICSPDKVTSFKIAPKSICPPDKVTPFKIAPKPICTPDKVTPFKIAKKPICTPDKFTLFKIAAKTICTPDKVTPFKIAPKPICPPDKVTPFKIAPKPTCTPDEVGIPITTETYPRPDPAQDHGSEEEKDGDIKSENTDDVSTDGVVKTEVFFVDGANEGDERTVATLDIVKSESDDDVIISGVSGGQTTSQAWRSNMELNSSCPFRFEKVKDEDIKSENPDVNASDVRVDDVNTDKVTTGGGIDITEEYFKEGAKEGDGTREDIVHGSPQEMVTCLSCSTVRIGSYRFKPNEQVVVSSNGIKIVAPSLKNESDVTLQIQLKDVVKISVRYTSGFRIIFLDTQFKCGAYIRKALEMSEESGLYYDPESKHDPYQKIILSPEKISQEAKVALQSLFGELLTELTIKETNKILFKTFCPQIITPVTKMSSRSASASIAFGTKRSTPAETKRIMICPADQGGIPVATEANTRLAQDQRGDRSSKKIIQASVQEMVVTLNCHTVRIGSYKYAPKEKVHISTDGIQIVAPSLKNGCRDVAIQIQLKEVVKISVHYGKGLLVVFLDTLIRCGAYIREALGMSEESGLYFDPGSKHDPYKRIIFFAKEISEKAQVVLKSLFGKLLEALHFGEAIRNSVKTVVEKKTTIYLSANIESGTKCSAKGGVPINTDTYTCPTQEHGDEEEKDEDIKSESTDVNAGDVNTDDVNTDDITTSDVLKTEECFFFADEGDEQSDVTLDNVKSESEEDVIISSVSGGQTTSQAWRSNMELNSSCPNNMNFDEEKDENIKSENTDVNASDVRADDVNTDEVTTGGGVVITEECCEDGADEGEEPEPRPENPHQNNTSGLPMSCMESLPDKLLLSNNVPARRLVGTHSLDAIDSSDSFWKTLCSKDFGNIEEDKKFSKLSYRDLYESLSLWDKVEEAQVIEKELPLDPACAVGSFKLIGDKLLGVATIQTYRLKGEIKYFDTIMYFDSDSLELISQETYAFLFDQYDENDKLIVLFEQRIRLHVIIKSNKNNFVYDIKKQYDYDVLSDNEIFFVNTNGVVCTARLKVVDGEETMETEKLSLAKMFPRSYIVAFARVNENVVNILVDGGTKLLIYCCELKNLNICGEINHSTQCDVVSKLREYGFNWCNPYVFRTLRCSTFTTNNQMYFTESVSPRNRVALVCTNEGSVNIFKRPYLDSGELYLSNIRPTTTIKIVNESLVMQQLDVVEILNGHRIFVRAGYNIFIFDLIHDQDRRANKRKADTGISTSATKKARSADEQ